MELSAEERSQLYSGFKAMLTVADTPWSVRPGIRPLSWPEHTSLWQICDLRDRPVGRPYRGDEGHREADRLVQLVNAARLL